MGLISYIKEHYYNSKLNKADRLLSEGNALEAELIYNDILDKQPLAASRLVEYYYSVAQKSNVNRMLDLLKKAIDLEKKASCVYEVHGYNRSLAKFTDFVVTKAKSLLANGSFNDSYRLLKAVNQSKNKSETTLNLCSEANVNQLYTSIKSAKITDVSFGVNLQELSKEWRRGKNIQSLVKLTQSFCKDLESAKRYYLSNSILVITTIGGYQNKCLDNAVQIVSGKDIDVTATQQKEIVSKYGKSIILRKGITATESSDIFKYCWDVSKDTKVILDVLNSIVDNDTQNAIIDCIFKNHKSFLADKKLFEGFSKWIAKDSNAKSSLDNLEKLNCIGYDVEELYTDKLSSWIKSLSTDERVTLLNHAHTIYPNSSKIIAHKLECAKCYESKKENDKAITVAESIIKQCSEAKTLKAKALCNKADNAQDFDSKEALLNEAEGVISKLSNSESKTVIDRINKTLLSVAEGFYSNNKTERAYALLDKLGHKGFEEAVICIAKYKLLEVKTINNSGEIIIAIKNAISFIKGFGICSILQCAEYQSLWSERSNAVLLSCKNESNAQAIAILEQFVTETKEEGFEASVKKQLTKSVITEIINRKYLIARDLEASKKFEEASGIYQNINKLEAKRTPTLSALRFILCKLKIQNYSDIISHKDGILTLLRNAAEAFKSEKEDIAYRFALILLKSGEDKEALAVLDEFLPSEEYLKKACLQGDMIKAQAKLEDFNNKLDAVKNKTLSSDEAIRFINSMLEYAEVIKPILSIPRPTLTKYRNKLKNYAIFKLFDEERYDVAFKKMLKIHPDYLEDYSALRNIALLCLNMAESGQMNRTNYKDVIAVWLTAVYQELLFVKTLDYTSWDDQFTFTLYDAYGHFNENIHDDLPDNVNFDDSDDSNIVSIKEVQRTLLDRFEAAISENQVFHNFFSFQKDAMDSFIALDLDEKCRIVAPHLAKVNSELFDGIANALETDREREYDNWENVLSVGAIYQMPQSIYNDYNNAKSNYDACIENLESFNSSRVNTTFHGAKISGIKKFNNLYSALISNANSKVSALSANNKTDFRKKYNYYLVVCSSIKDRILSFNFSNFIMSFVVGEVNDKKMKLSEASEYILSAYTLDSSNARIKENLETLFEMLCRETASDSVTAVNNILAKVRSCDSSFYNSLNNKYQDVKITKELNSIVDKVNSHTMSESSALSIIYTMYESNPDHPGICNNLAQLSEICIIKYIVQDASGASSVRTILNKLKNNKSAEFKKHSSVFIKAYNDFWNQLPYETRQLLSDSTLAFALGKTLNSNGLALKNGLNLMKELGGGSTTSGRSSILNGLGGYLF